MSETILAFQRELHTMPFSKSRSKRLMLRLAGLALCVSILGPPAIGQQVPAVSVDVNLVNVLVDGS